MKLLPALTALSLLAAAPSHATVLTFDVAGIFDFQSMPAAYGDNVTSTVMGPYSYGSAQGFTPNVSVQYGNTLPALWRTGYGDLTNVLFEDSDAVGVLNVTFTADPGYLVFLHSFDLASYSSSFATDPSINSVKVFDASNAPLFSQSNVSVSKVTHTPFSFPTALSGSSLRIEVNALNLGGLNDDIAIDNITFSQAVPEPSSGVLLTLGVVAAAARRRQR